MSLRTGLSFWRGRDDSSSRCVPIRAPWQQQKVFRRPAAPISLLETNALMAFDSARFVLREQTSTVALGIEGHAGRLAGRRGFTDPPLALVVGLNDSNVYFDHTETVV